MTNSHNSQDEQEASGQPNRHADTKVRLGTLSFSGGTGMVQQPDSMGAVPFAEDCEECQPFQGRLKDICLGIGLDGRPKPTAKTVMAFRDTHGIVACKPAWDVSQPSRGLGDTIAKFTHATGLDKVAGAVAKAFGKKDCGCKKRQEKLNAAVPYVTHPVTVVIISHNYGEYLREAIDSAEANNPLEIIIVDDASEDDTQRIAKKSGYRYLRHESRNVWQSRKLGFENAKGKYICFLDADDKLPAGYLENAVQQMDADGSIGLVFSDLQLFGLESTLKRHDAGVNLEHRNNYHSGSVVRWAALETSQVFDADYSTGFYHLDWMMWRQVIRHGWKAAKNQHAYLYRRHGTSMTARRDKYVFYEYAQLAREMVTICIPLSGRRESVERLSKWLLSQTWPPQQCRLLFASTNSEVSLAWGLANRVAHKYRNIRIEQMECGSPGLADENRKDRTQDVQIAVAQIYAKLRMMVDTEYCLIVEDDVIPPVDAVDNLMRGMDERVASVTGVGWSRYAPWYIHWTGTTHATTLRTGVEDISGSWFGCTLLRRSCWLDAPMTCDGRGGNYDYAFSDWLQQRGWKCRVNWDVHCQHGDLLPTDTWRKQGIS